MTTKNDLELKAAFGFSVEQSVFRLLSEGKAATALDAVALGLLQGEKYFGGFRLKLVRAANVLIGIDTLEQDLLKPPVPPDNGGSYIKHYGITHYHARINLVLEDVLKYHARGVARFEKAMSQPLPEKWTWTTTAPDNFLARFPEQIYLGWGNRPGELRFFLSRYNDFFQTTRREVLQAGEKVHPLWYCDKATIAYGDIEYGVYRKGEHFVTILRESSACDITFICPTPTELYEGRKAGFSIKDMIHRHINEKRQ